MALPYSIQQAKCEQALATISPGQKVSYRALARLHACPYRMLLRMAHGKPSRTTRPLTNQRLTEEQKSALELYIHRLDEIRQPPLIPMWRAAAEQIRALTSPPGTVLQPLGRDFFTRYLNANPHIKKIKQKGKDLQRVAAQERDVISSFFT